MCRLAYVERENGNFDEYDKNVLIKMCHSAYNNRNVDGYFIRFSSGARIRTLNFEEYLDFIERNYEGSNSAHLHLRLASNGGVKEDWIHGWRFKFNDMYYRVSHNGIFSDNRKDKRKFTNDSYQFFYNLFRTKGNTMKRKIKRYVKTQKGSGVVCILGENNREIYFIGIDTSAYVAVAERNDGERLFIMASKKDVISDIKEKIENKCVITYNGISLESTEKLVLEDNIKTLTINSVEDDKMICREDNGVFRIIKLDIDKYSYTDSTYNRDMFNDEDEDIRGYKISDNKHSITPRFPAFKHPIKWG